MTEAKLFKEKPLVYLRRNLWFSHISNEIYLTHSRRKRANMQTYWGPPSWFLISVVPESGYPLVSSHLSFQNARWFWARIWAKMVFVDYDSVNPTKSLIPTRWSPDDKLILWIIVIYSVELWPTNWLCGPISVHTYNYWWLFKIVVPNRPILYIFVG